MKNNKKGFTLIEIIISLVLITLIGTISILSVSKYSNKQELNILKSNDSVFKNALEVYLANHPEVTEHVNNDVKAAVVSLELLKNEGLIKDDYAIDYKNNYFTLSKAILLQPSGGTEACANQVELKTFASWEIDKDASEVIYICPNNGGGSISFSQVNLILNKMDYVAKGSNPNNYVKINYDSQTYIFRISEIINGNIFLIGASSNLKLKTDDYFTYDVVSGGGDKNYKFLNTVEPKENNTIFSEQVILKKKDYIWSSGNDFAGVPTGIQKTYNSYVGFINQTNIINSLSTDGSWLRDNLIYSTYNKNVIMHMMPGGTSPEFYNFVYYSNIVNTNDSISWGEYTPENKVTGDLEYFIPVVCLADDKTLKVDATCSINEVGSEICPYIVN